MALRGKMQRYAEGRASGMEPHTAGAHAGYAPGPGLAVAVSRIEARVDVQKEIKRLKKGGAPTGAEAEVATTTARADWAMKDKYEDPLSLLKDIMNNPDAPKSLRYQAAKDALPYCHPRIAEAGKKEKKEELAKKTSGAGRFQRKSAPQRAHVVN